MSAQADYYETLGVGRDASDADIRRAFRSLARKYHPDVAKTAGAEDRFKEINKAYEVLRDPEKRKLYDRFGSEGPASPFPAGGQDFSGFGDIFDAFFGGGRPRGSRGPEGGADLRATLNLGFLESVFGVEKALVYDRLEPCGTCGGGGSEPGSKASTCRLCGGSGQVRRAQRSVFGQFVNVSTCGRCGGGGQEITNPCRTCHGAGLERKRLERTINVPAGLQPGTDLRLTGEGDHGPRGGPPGDLYVAVGVTPHPRLLRDQDDIVSGLRINMAEATLGAAVDVETVDGPSTIKIPAGTQPGAVLTLKGLGVPRYGGAGRGNHRLTVQVQIPSKVSREQRGLLEQLRESLPEGGSEDAESFAERLRAAFR